MICSYDHNSKQLSKIVLLLKHMLAALSPKYREVLDLKYYFGLSHREIATLLDVSENVVSKRYEKAKRIILEMMEDEMYG